MSMCPVTGKLDFWTYVFTAAWVSGVFILLWFGVISA